MVFFRGNQWFSEDLALILSNEEGALVTWKAFLQLDDLYACVTLFERRRWISSLKEQRDR